MRNRRLGWLPALALALSAGVVPLAGAAAQGPCPSVAEVGPWGFIAPPEWPNGGSLTTFTIDPRDPATLFATNGAALMRSTDGGCSWSLLLTIDDLPQPPVGDVPLLQSRIVQIAVAEKAFRVFLALEERTGPVVRPHVLVSDDGGRTWNDFSDGLPLATGGGLRLRPAPGNPEVAYLLAASVGTGTTMIMRTDDGGASWETRNEGAGGVIDLAVDPLDADDLWLWGAVGIARSYNGGGAIEPTPISGVTTVGDLFHAPGRPPRFMGYDPDGGTMLVTRDGGATWDRIGAPRGVVLSMAHGNTSDDVLAGQVSNLSRFLPPRFWLDLLPPAPGIEFQVRDLVVSRTAHPLAFGRMIVGESSFIVSWKGLGEVVRIDDFDLVGRDVKSALPRLTPARRTIRLAPGASRTVPYRLTVPAEETGLDVFFLVDTTSSMQSTINGLREGMQQVINELALSGIDVQFGVGEYKDYPLPGFGDPRAGDYPYRLLRKVGVVGPDLANALAQLRATGGGDIPESQLTGLYQAATGAGEAPYTSPAIEPGGDAGFRSGSLRVIVNITDAPFHDSAAHPSPPSAEVEGVLREHGIKQIGLAVYGPNGATQAMASLSKMAEATGTFAPPGGVDCNGDGRLDLAEGDPLVCRVFGEVRAGVRNLAPAIIGSLKALRRESTARLAIERGARVVAGDLERRALNRLEPNDLRFPLAFTCPRAFAGNKRVVEIAGVVDDRPLARATATVVCLPGPEIAAPEAPVPPIVPPAPIAALVIVPPAPVGPIPEGAPGPQSNPQAQAGLASQEEEQLQVAAAYQGAEPAEQEEYAFSSYRARRPQPSPAPLYLGAAGLLSAAAALALRRAEVRVRTAHSRRAP